MGWLYLDSRWMGTQSSGTFLGVGAPDISVGAHPYPGACVPNSRCLAPKYWWAPTCDAGALQLNPLDRPYSCPGGAIYEVIKPPGGLCGLQKRI